MANGRKVIVIGIDGADYYVINRFMSEGFLQTFKELFETGTPLLLESTIPVSSAPAWTSFLTGVPPKLHGIHGFILRSKNGRRIPANYNTIGATTIFDILKTHGKRILSINVPMTAPAPKIKGSVIISGFSNYDMRITEKTVHPPILAGILRRQYGYEVIEPEGSPDIFDYIKKAIELDIIRMEILNDLLWSDNFDVVLFVFTASDRIQHFLWASIDPIHPLYKKLSKYSFILCHYYQMIDRFVKVLIKEFDSDNVRLIIVSDHGFRSVYFQVHIENILYKNGLFNINVNFKKMLMDLLLNVIDEHYHVLRSMIAIADFNQFLTKIFNSIIKDVKNKAVEANIFKENLIDVLDQHDAWFVNWNLIRKIFNCTTVDINVRKKIAKIIAKTALASILDKIQDVYINEYDTDLSLFQPDIVFQLKRPFMASGPLLAPGLPNITKTERLTGTHDKYGILIVKDNNAPLENKLELNNTVKIHEATRYVYDALNINLNNSRAKIINILKRMKYREIMSK